MRSIGDHLMLRLNALCFYRRNFPCGRRCRCQALLRISNAMPISSVNQKLRADGDDSVTRQRATRRRYFVSQAAPQEAAAAIECDDFWRRHFQRDD